MKRLRVRTFLAATEATTKVAGRTLSVGHVPIPDNHRPDGIRIFRDFLQVCTDLNLIASAATIRRIVEVYENPNATYGQLREALRDLPTRLQDEMAAMVVFCLTAAESEHYENPRKGWEEIIARFPDGLMDIEEARKCFALGRYAGAVFHSLQVVETGLLDLGVFLKVPDPKSGWTAVSNALDQVIQKKHQNRSRFERKHFAFLEQVQGTVAALKNAWRNKVSHAQGKLTLLSPDFSPDVAEEILVATRAFMRRLAEGLPARKVVQL